MKSMKATLFLAAIMALVFTSCHSNREKEKIDIHGQWEMEGEKNHVELQIYNDSTFHVNLLTQGSIEVHGKLQLKDNRITFINTHGTDPISSNSAPGAYEYSLKNDSTLSFSKIKDPLDRRAGFMEKDWIKK